MKKVTLVILAIFISIFFGSLPLYAHSHGGGGGGGNGLIGGTEFTLEPPGFHSVSQSGTSDSTIDINNIRPLTQEELEKRIRADKIREQAWSALNSLGWTAVEHVLHAGEIGAEITVFTAGVALSALATPAELSAAVALAIGGGYSIVTTYVKGGSAEDGGKAGVQTVIVSIIIQNAPVTGSLVDFAISNMPDHSNEQGTSAPRNDLPDYGLGYQTTAGGIRQMN